VLRNNSDIDGDGDYAREIMQEKNYYPFGLQQKGYNDLIVSEHNYGFIGKERQQELGLEWIDFGARNYDASLGRWMNLDPLSDDIMQIDLTPYNFSWNNPININDPDGKCPSCAWGAAIGFLVEYGSQVATNYINGETGLEAWSNIDGGKLLVATGTGALTGGLSALKVAGATAKVYKATAMTTAVAAGNIVEQKMDINKAINENKPTINTINAGELGLEVIADKLPIPTVKYSKSKEVSGNVITAAQNKVKRAENIAGNNPRPSRAQAIKEAKKNVSSLKIKQKVINTENTIGPQLYEAIDSSEREFYLESMKYLLLENNEK
uniref:RHS repeat domain-containing protein n=1 Tax=uncultured Aquimarina sp. TaxID=575652 RepID=UPI00261E8465